MPPIAIDPTLAATLPLAARTSAAGCLKTVPRYNPVHQKNGLRDIQSNRRDLLHHRSPSDSPADHAAGGVESRPHHQKQTFLQEIGTGLSFVARGKRPSSSSQPFSGDARRVWYLHKVLDSEPKRVRFFGIALQVLQPWPL
jgi:hypothetical protein